MIAFLKCFIFGHKYGRFVDSTYFTVNENNQSLSIPRIARFCKCCNEIEYLYPEGEEMGYNVSRISFEQSSYYAELFNKENNL